MRWVCVAAMLWLPMASNASSTIEPAATYKQGRVRHRLLRRPERATKTAPAQFDVRFDTSAGRFVVRLHRAWAPIGVDRLYNLVRIGYFTDVRFYRVIDHFVAQFGLHGDPEVNLAWANAKIPDDPFVHSNVEGTFCFATCARPDCRNTQFYINLKDNEFLDNSGFFAMGEVTDGMHVVRALYAGYGERAGRDQGIIGTRGNALLDERYPRLDRIYSATFVGRRVKAND